MTFLQSFFICYGTHDLLEFTQIFAALLDPLEILFELAGLKNRFHAFQLSNSSSVELNCSKLRPLLESSRALIVSSLGLDTSK